VGNAARCLSEGGTLHIATDDVPYADQIADVLAAESRLRNVHAPDPWLADVPGRIPTGYELDWRAAGRPLHFFAHQRMVVETRGR
jgi:tRNA G46 methylase TrmB